MKVKCRAPEKKLKKGAGLVAEEGNTKNLFMASS